MYILRTEKFNRPKVASYLKQFMYICGGSKQCFSPIMAFVCISGDSMSIANGRSVFTKDSDGDQCAGKYFGEWWYTANCYYVDLNRKYLPELEATSTSGGGRIV